jgi:hypothetical protein
MKYGFVYIWYDRKHKRFYIGCHWGEETDRYICSSKWMNRSYKRRPQDFRRKILSRIMTNKTDLLDEEYRWLSKIKKEELGKRYYNVRNHHTGHWSTCPVKSKNVLDKNKAYWTEEKRRDASERKMGDLNPMKDPKVVEKRLKTYNKGNHQAWNKGISTGKNPEHSERMKGREPPNKGKPMSDKQKMKVSENSKDRIWIYCPVTLDTKTIKNYETIPEGYIRGRPKGKSKKCVTIQINNITYDSYAEASFKLNISPNIIRSRCHSGKDEFSNYIVLRK